MVGYLNRKGYHNIIIVDDFTEEEKKHVYEDKKICARVDRNELFEWLSHYQLRIDFVFHLGARTDTAEFDYKVLEKLNVEYSKQVWNYCTEKSIPLVYASSAATYGNGEFGYKDDHEVIKKLKPLNPYGDSKNEFDIWAVEQASKKKNPPFWAGMKFFNVFGPNEYHKGRMASVIFHAFNEIRTSGQMKLFRSHRKDFKDGEQLRDFIYVKDIVDICFWLMQEQPESGLYNAGTGKARTFNDLAHSLFKSLNQSPCIEYIDIPEDIRDKYQYHTEADLTKLRSAGYKSEFYTLEEGIDTYVNHFLRERKYY